MENERERKKSGTPRPRPKPGGSIPAGVGRRIRRILRDDPDFLVPVKKLHKFCLEDVSLPPYADFLAALRAAPDLVVMETEGTGDEEGMSEPGPSVPPKACSAEMPASSEVEMEALGYYDGPRVRLKDRVPTPSDLAAILKRHTDRMMESLGQAYCSAADQLSEEEEDAMMDLLKHAKSLKAAVDKMNLPGDDPGNDGRG